MSAPLTATSPPRPAAALASGMEPELVDTNAKTVVMAQTLNRTRQADNAPEEIGTPPAHGQLLLQNDCTVTIAHSRTRDLPDECARAEILVAAIGRPKAIRGEWIREGAVVIDVGINRVDAGDGKSKVVGDVDYVTAVARAGAITPVPGGVGPMTIACLLMNTLNAAVRARFGGSGELLRP